MESKTLEGRKHLVVPAVMITVGVHNGSAGPVFYPASELQKSVPFWNAKPVVVYHPDLSSGGIAGSPVVFNQQKIGTLFNVRFEGNALKCECWIDPERCASVDNRVLSAIQKNSVVEVSTGLFCDFENEKGVWNGEDYDAIARNIRPDHLAILPDLIGACSIADGAGLCRNVAGYLEPLSLTSTYPKKLFDNQSLAPHRAGRHHP